MNVCWGSSCYYSTMAHRFVEGNLVPGRDDKYMKNKRVPWAHYVDAELMRNTFLTLELKNNPPLNNHMKQRKSTSIRIIAYKILF